MFEKIFKAAAYLIESTVMSYNSLVFFLCVLAFLGILFLLRSQRAKIVWILIANLVFYLWAGGFAGFTVIFVTAILVYLCGRKMGTVYEDFESVKKDLAPKEQVALLNTCKKRTRKYLWLALFLIIGTWICVKIGRLYNSQTVSSWSDWFSGKGILVPLGISYYTLSSVGYLLDVYWRKASPEQDFVSLLTVITFFPHIVQGPIGKYSRLLKQLHQLPAFDYRRVCFGLQLMLWGYIKKLVIADRLALYTSTVFAAPASFAGVEILLAVILCIFQLYADFSGCMDIVGGIAQAMGVELDANFRQPFFARSAAEFWRRWHITLGAWTKDYLYMPIAVNPNYMKWSWKLKKKYGSYPSSLIQEGIPLFLVWLFTGLWHGTGWDYVAWGMYWFLIMLLSQAAKPLNNKLTAKLGIHTERHLFRTWQSVRTCALFAVGRMFTVTGSLSGCALLWKRLFADHRLWTLFDGSLYNYGVDRKYFYVMLAGIAIMLLVDSRHEKGVRIRETIAGTPLPVRWAIYLAAIFTVVIFGVYGSGYDASSFVYGAF